MEDDSDRPEAKTKCKTTQTDLKQKPDGRRHRHTWSKNQMEDDSDRPEAKTKCKTTQTDMKEEPNGRRTTQTYLKQEPNGRPHRQTWSKNQTEDHTYRPEAGTAEDETGEAEQRYTGCNEGDGDSQSRRHHVRHVPATVVVPAQDLSTTKPFSCSNNSSCFHLEGKMM